MVNAHLPRYAEWYLYQTLATDVGRHICGSVWISLIHTEPTDRRSNFEFESNILLFFRQVFFDTILARGFCLAFLGEANGKHADHVIVSCLDIYMSLNEVLLLM